MQSVRLSIFEPPRLFEAFLRGRAAAEVPDITARICGICPVAYQMSSVHAMETAFGMQPGPEIRALRRLLYCGEYIESHALHMVMLHAPDFLGYEDGIAMAAAHGDLVQARAGGEEGRQRADDACWAGGRSTRSTSALGGFYRLPDPRRTRRPAARPGPRARRRGGNPALGRRLRLSRCRARLGTGGAAPSRPNTR